MKASGEEDGRAWEQTPLGAEEDLSVESRRELSVHNCLALAPDEPKVISGAPLIAVWPSARAL
jgi:hypothetical protein